MKLRSFQNIAIINGERRVSYPDLLQNIGVYARHTPHGKQTTVQETTKVIIFSENREEWIYAFFSIWRNHSIAIPVDASSTVSDLAYILNDCRPTAIWTSLSHVDTVRKAMDSAKVDLQILILDDMQPVTASTNGQPISLGEQEYPANDIALIIYTSGTTGSPKGVMLSFANLESNMYGVSTEVPIYNEHARALILLPLHHVLPLMGTMIIPIIQGGGVAICPTMTGPDIMNTLCNGKVNVFIGVPRLWQMLYSGIKKKIDEKAITRMLFSLCKKIGSRSLSRFIFQSVHKKLGGHITYCVSGGAALDKEIGEGLKTLGLDVLEGYGMTETAPIIAFTRPGDIKPGCVGLPLPSVKCKLIDGELCAKGPNVMVGYYNRPQETADVIDKDGYIHTGDLATIDEAGRVTITGRKKEIIVLSNGKNVQPCEIEFQLEKNDSIVKECAVTDRDDMLVAIIVPQELWARGKSDAEIEKLIKHEIVEPYNRTVENYKKVMRIHVYHNDLPRTRMDKLQRFKLKDIIAGKKQKTEASNISTADIKNENWAKTFIILKQYIEDEKKMAVSPESHIEMDLAFDSLDRVSFQGFIEQSFGVSINAADMPSFENIKAIAEHIDKQKTKSEVEHVNWHELLTSSSTHLVLPTTSATMPLGGKLFKSSFILYNSLSIHGKENLPQKGPFILAANHQSFLDGPLAVSGMSWSQIKECYFYATEEHVQHPVVKYLASHNNVILMEEKNLKNSILKLAEVLKKDKNVIIFPEGSRTHSGEIGKFRKMFAILAIELNVPILPVVIKGAFEAMPRGQSKIKAKHIDVTYLPTVQPSGNYDSFSQHIRDIILKEFKK